MHPAGSRELHDPRYVQRHRSISAFLDAEGKYRARGGDRRQAPFKNAAQEVFTDGLPEPSYRRIDLSSGTFDWSEHPSNHLLGAYEARADIGTAVAIGKADTLRGAGAGAGSGAGSAHTYENCAKSSAEIWRRGARFGKAPRPCSADIVATRSGSDSTAASSAEKQREVAAADQAESETPGDEAAEAEEYMQDVVDALRLEVGLRCWVSGGPQGGRGAEMVYVGKVPELGRGWWVGLSFDEKLGKNDGSLPCGKRYFDTEKGYGGFFRPSRVRLGEYDPEEEAARKVEAALLAHQKMKEATAAKLRAERDPITSLPFDPSTARDHAQDADFRSGLRRFDDLVAQQFKGTDGEVELAPGEYEVVTPRGWRRHDLTITKRVGRQVYTKPRLHASFEQHKTQPRKKRETVRCSDRSTHDEPVAGDTCTRQSDEAHSASVDAEQSSTFEEEHSVYPAEILQMLLNTAKPRVDEEHADEPELDPSLRRHQDSHAVRVSSARSVRPTSASFAGLSREARKLRSCRGGGRLGTAHRRANAGGVDPHFSASLDERAWSQATGGSAWGGQVQERNPGARMGLSLLTSSDLNQGSDIGQPIGRSEATSLSSIAAFVSDHPPAARPKSAGDAETKHAAIEGTVGRPSSAGWSAGGPLTSARECASLASLAGLAEAAVQAAGGSGARRQAESSRRLMGAGKRPALTRSKAVRAERAPRQRRRTKGTN